MARVAQTQKTIEINALDYNLTNKDISLIFRYFYKFFQKILLIVSYIIAYTLSRFKIEGRENTRNIKGGPLLVIANHKSYLDPLLIGTCFPFFSKIFPLRFMAWDDLFRDVFYGPAMRILGAFPAFVGKGMDKSLYLPRKILKSRGTVIFFPEGECHRAEGLLRPKRGVGVLASDFPNVSILPIAISGTYKVKSIFSIFIRPRITIKIGEPFRLADKRRETGESLSSDIEIAKALMSEVEKNYKQIS